MSAASAPRCATEAIKDRCRALASRRRESGQSFIELAIVLTLFSLLVLGAIDIGRLYGVNEQVTNAAHEGAKLAAQYYSPSSGYSDSATIAGYVRSEVVQEGLLDNSQITGLTVTEPPAYSEESVVSVTVQYHFAFYGPWALFPGLRDISISSTSAEAVP